MNFSKQEFETIVKICERAEAMGLHEQAKAMGLSNGDRFTMIMDLQNTHDTIGLSLEGLLAADDMDFAHDILGIQANINRDTKEMENFFLPRYAKQYHSDVAQVITDATTKAAEVNAGMDNSRGNVEKDIEQ